MQVKIRRGTAFCWVGNGSEQVARAAIVNLRYSTLLVNSFVEFKSLYEGNYVILLYDMIICGNELE